MAPHITHIALHVRDMDECVAFYADFCGMATVHQRGSGDRRVVWLAEPGREREFIFVVIPGGERQKQPTNDYTHFGFALESRAAVDAIAERARAANRLAWPPSELPYPVGYFCGVTDPDGNVVEFSYGQPLGPGAPEDPPSSD